MSGQRQLIRAKLTPVGKPDRCVNVHFNPVSIEHSVALKTDDKQQFTGPGTAKIAMDLIFDTTDTGVDVRSHTQRVLMLLKPEAGNDPKAATKLVPPQVDFEWGAFKFTGVLEAFAETLDFWAPDGVPLRASMKITLAAPEFIFPPSVPAGTAPAAVFLPGGSPGGVAAAGGDPGAARDIATANGLESLRADAPGGLVVPSSPGELLAPAAFAPPLAAGASLDITAGVGSQLGAGLSITEGAFAGLHTETTRPSAALSPEKILDALASPPLAADATFDVSGRALSPGGSAFRADVRGSIRFDA